MSKIAVINCGSTKKDYACSAREMYDGGHLFRTIRDFVEQNYDEYYILSGHYGLIRPDEIIEPYDDVVFFVQKIFRDRAKKQGKILKAVSKENQKLWGKKVWNAIDWESYDHDGGVKVEGFPEKQWVYFPQFKNGKKYYEWALWKALNRIEHFEEMVGA